MGWYDDKIGLDFLRDRRDLLFEIDTLAKDSKAPRIFLPRPIAYGEQPRFCEQTLLLALSIGIRPACVGARVRFTVNVDQEEVGAEPLGKTNQPRRSLSPHPRTNQWVQRFGGGEQNPGTRGIC